MANYSAPKLSNTFRAIESIVIGQFMPEVPIGWLKNNFHELIFHRMWTMLGEKKRSPKAPDMSNEYDGLIIIYYIFIY